MEPKRRALPLRARQAGGRALQQRDRDVGAVPA
eukprot:SAG11_NODE_7994_length_1072_cov_1.364851_1_plen_32_part_10